MDFINTITIITPSFISSLATNRIYHIWDLQELKLHYYSQWLKINHTFLFWFICQLLEFRNHYLSHSIIGIVSNFFAHKEVKPNLSLSHKVFGTKVWGLFFFKCLYSTNIVALPCSSVLKWFSLQAMFVGFIFAEQKWSLCTEKKKAHVWNWNHSFTFWQTRKLFHEAS